MFWKYHDMCSSNINTLLSSEDVTLQKLMDEDDVIQECKSGNTKLVNFLVRPDVLSELVALVSKEPPLESPELTRFKYNNIAAELLTCDLEMITASLASSDQLLGQLCDFLNAENELNPLMASFFSKTLSLLITRKPKMLLDFLKTQENFIARVLKNLRTSAMMDLVVKMVACIDDRDAKQLFAQWLCHEHLVEQVISLLDSSGDSSTHANVAQLMTDLLRMLRDMQAQASVMNYSSGSVTSNEVPQENDIILSVLESKSTADLLLTQILDKDPSESCLVHGINALLPLMETRKPLPQLGNIEPESGDRPLVEPVITTCFRNTVEAVVPRLKDLHQLLVTSPQETATHIAFVEKPLGAVRLQITRLITALLSTGSWEVQKELAALGTIGVLLDMFVEYSHNNFLHGQVERSVQIVLGLKPSHLLQPAGQVPVEVSAESEAQLHSLLADLLVDKKLVERILNAWEANNINESKGARRYSYMGHLIRMANHVVEYGKNGANSQKIQALLAQLPDQLQQRWHHFAQTELAQANRNNEIQPVKSDMSAPKSSSEDEDVEIRQSSPRDAAAQEAFTEYQMEAMSKNAVTQFGFADNQFTDNEDHRTPPQTLVNISLPDDDDDLQNQSAMFEQVCSEKIQMGDLGALPMSSGKPPQEWNTARGSPNDEGKGAADMEVEETGLPAVMDTANPWESQGNWNTQNSTDNWANFEEFPSAFSADVSSAFPTNESNNSETSPETAPPTEQQQTTPAPGTEVEEKDQHGNGPV